MLPTTEITMREYEDGDGDSPFGDWFDELDSAAAARVTIALIRLEQGNFGDSKPVGEGVVERRIPFGPGYRVYYGRDGATLVILLGGGTKQRQDRDIETAKWRWDDFQRRKQGLDTKTWH